MPQKKKKKQNQTKQQTFLITNAINKCTQTNLILKSMKYLDFIPPLPPIPLNPAEYNQYTQVPRTNWNATSKKNSKLQVR